MLASLVFLVMWATVSGGLVTIAANIPAAASGYGLADQLNQFQAVNGALSTRSPCVSERKMARSLALTSVWQLPDVFARELPEIPEIPIGT